MASGIPLEENEVLEHALNSENPKPARYAALLQSRKVICMLVHSTANFTIRTDIEFLAVLNEYLFPRRAVSNVLLQLVHD